MMYILVEDNKHICIFHIVDIYITYGHVCIS